MASRSLQNTFLSFIFLSTFVSYFRTAFAVTDYANAFIDPELIVSKNLNASTTLAQRTMQQWASSLTEGGPWSVTFKSVTPPSGSKHDYLSYAPYYWADCSQAGNTTALTDEEARKQCNWIQRDGQINPASRDVTDIDNFETLGDAVLYNTITWALQGDSSASANSVKYIRTWFLDSDTAMAPNLNFAQMQGGPDGQTGSHTGVLDLKCMTKVVNSILILRSGKSADWTSDLDGQMVGWAKEYISWLQSSPLAQKEAASTNNHGTFFYNQLAALQILVGDKDGARGSLQAYFNGIYQNQIQANGEQPEEAQRTRPYHYRAYNLAAMITNARLGEYIGFDGWSIKTSQGATIQTAVDYTMTVDPGEDTAEELYPNVAAVAAHYGDPDGKYGSFLMKKLGTDLAKQPYFAFNTFSVSGLPTSYGTTSSVKTSATKASAASSSTSTAKISAGPAPWESAALSITVSWMFLGIASSICLLMGMF
ncbi:hypothetical protein QCA50_013171 [Cerrena zonata]|uniref:Alginate lyase domain-containing protein n=1 Tax=Cerrena zonata TaxID=2478898 RepID=A0AAW0FY46_9APHY